MSKITIIGSGSVGSTIAYTLSTESLATEIVLIDINRKKADGEVMDIVQGTSFRDPISIEAGDYADAKDSDIVIITSGAARKPGMSRLDLAQTNVDVLKQLTGKIVKAAPNATYIIVSNPVDVLTYAFCKYSGIPEERIIGSGTILDTARLRSCLAEYYTVNQQNVHAFVLGEHGDSSFVPWSVANISNVPIDQYATSLTEAADFPEFKRSDVEEYVRKSGATIIESKGATFYAVSMSVAYICKSLLSGIDTTMTVSTMLHGEYGLYDICLSLLNVVGEKGAHSKVLLPLNDEEIKQLYRSAGSLRTVINSIKL